MFRLSCTRRMDSACGYTSSTRKPHDFGVILHGTLRSHLNVPPPDQRFHHHEQIARTFAFIFVIDALRLAGLNRNRRVNIGMQHDRFRRPAQIVGYCGSYGSS